jgi:hypothetical protein
MFTSHDDILSGLCNLAILNELAATHYIDVRITVPVSGPTSSVFQIPGTRFQKFTLRWSVLYQESSREVWQSGPNHLVFKATVTLWRPSPPC